MTWEMIHSPQRQHILANDAARIHMPCPHSRRLIFRRLFFITPIVIPSPHTNPFVLLCAEGNPP